MSNTSKASTRAGRILTAMVTLMVAGSGMAKLAGAPKMVDGLIHAGFPRTAIVPIAVLELVCVALYLIPRTAGLGTLLLTGFFGGAVVTHIIGGESFFPPLIVGLLIWAGAYFRVPAFARLLPFGEVQEQVRESAPSLPQPGTGLFRFAPWINRLVLTAATFIFTMIGLRYIADPVHASAATGVTLRTALATTTTRIGFGAFPLAFALFSFACLLSARRLRVGVSLVATVITTAIVVRLFSLAADGAAAESVRLFVPEAMILALSIGGLMLETARSKAERGGLA